MISTRITAIIAVVAFAAGGFVMSPVPQAIAAVIATDVQCTGCVGTADLAGNAVTSAKIAGSAVQSSDIKDKGIAAIDIAPAFISGGFKADGQDGWNPEGSTTANYIRTITNVPNTSDSSVVAITVNNGAQNNFDNFFVCSVVDVFTGGFRIYCDGDPENGAFLDYIVINRS